MNSEEYLELKNKIEKLEHEIEVLEKNDRDFVEIIKPMLCYINKMKHPASRFVVVCSIVISTVINQLPTILSLL